MSTSHPTTPYTNDNNDNNNSSADNYLYYYYDDDNDIVLSNSTNNNNTATTITTTTTNNNGHFTNGVNFGETIHRPPHQPNTYYHRDDEQQGGGGWIGYTNDDTNGTQIWKANNNINNYHQQQQQQQDEQRNWVIVAILIVIIVVLWLVLGMMLYVPLARYLRRRMPVSQARIHRRYETIEGWLITKLVQSHDRTCCELQQSKYRNKSSNNNSSNNNNNEGIIKIGTNMSGVVAVQNDDDDDDDEKDNENDNDNQHNSSTLTNNADSTNINVDINTTPCAAAGGGGGGGTDGGGTPGTPGDDDIENQLLPSLPFPPQPQTSSLPPSSWLIKHTSSYGTTETSRTTALFESFDNSEPSSSSSSSSSVSSSNSSNNSHKHNNNGHQEESGGCTNYTMSNHQDRECSICMEEFYVGDVISWSPYQACSHVYHHQCIKEWLLRHNNCPFCRTIVLPVDQPDVRITVKIFQELSELRARRAERTYYCLEHGLVTLDQLPVSATKLLQQQQQDKKRNKNYSNKKKKKKKVCIKTTTNTASNNNNTNNDDDSDKQNKAMTCTTRTTTKSKTLDNRTTKSDESQHHRFREKLKAGITKADLRKLRGDPMEKKISIRNERVTNVAFMDMMSVVQDVTMEEDYDHDDDEAAAAGTAEEAEGGETQSLHSNWNQEEQNNIAQQLDEGGKKEEMTFILINTDEIEFTVNKSDVTEDTEMFGQTDDTMVSTSVNTIAVAAPAPAETGNVAVIRNTSNDSSSSALRSVKDDVHESKMECQSWNKFGSNRTRREKETNIYFAE